MCEVRVYRERQGHVVVWQWEAPWPKSQDPWALVLAKSPLGLNSAQLGRGVRFTQRTLPRPTSEILRFVVIVNG